MGCACSPWGAAPAAPRDPNDAPSSPTGPPSSPADSPPGGCEGFTDTSFAGGAAGSAAITSRPPAKGTVAF